MTVTGDPQDDVDLFTPAPPPRADHGLPQPPPSPENSRLWRRRGAVMVGMVSACVTLGIGLGVAVTSRSPIGAANQAPRLPAPMPGRDGLTPGSTPIVIALAGEFVATAVTVEPDATLLSTACPASAWDVRLVTPTRPGTVRTFVALAASAPQSCQGFTGELPLLVTLEEPVATGEDARWQVTARTAGPLSVGVLATPGLTLQRRADHVVVTPIRPPSGPEASTVSVETRSRGGGWTTICSRPTWTECAAAASDAGPSAQFRVITSLGSWSRASASVDVADLR